jgi:putative drug exporter of the RND superfamily
VKTILRFKWLVIAIWIAAIAGLIITAPNMTDLVRNQGQAFVPDGYSSSMASNLLDQMHKKDGKKGESPTALIFHNKKGLTASDKKEIQHAIRLLNDNKEKIGITNIVDSFSQPNLKEELVSKNGKTILVDVTVNLKDRDSKKVTEELYNVLKPISVEHYYTSEWMITNDNIDSTQQGLHKTEWITVVFILLVLFIVFRSVIAPFIPLVAVGVTFVVAQSILSFLVKWFNFPISNFTQIFLVAVLFGIGTDYCILLLSRFKEELPHHESVEEAVIQTFKNGGRTVFFSGLAVLIGFSTIGLSTFNIYQSACGVAVGIAVLIVALVTLVPIFMALLGPKLFWPTKKAIGHHQSRLWGVVGGFSLKRPIIALIIVAVITVPFILTYDGLKSFNSLNEISDSYKSVKGFNIIAEDFNPGEAMPTTIVLKNDERMDKRQYLQTIEAITREVKKVDHVKKVRSATQPLGKPLKDFLVPNQAQTLDEGLKQANVGINKIAGGLSDASTQLSSSAPQLQKATKGIGDLVNGTTDLKNGLVKLQGGLTQIQKGIQQGAHGATDLKKGLEDTKKGAEQLLANQQQLLNGYQTISTNLNQLSHSYNQIYDGLTSAQTTFQKYADEHPDAQNNPDYQKALGTLQSLLNGDNQQPGMKGLNSGLKDLSDTMDNANSGFAKIIQGQQQLNNGLSQLIDGITKLEAGLNQAADGQGQVLDNIPSMTSGATQIAKGQSNLQKGFSGLNDQMSQLIDGLGQSATGLNKVSSGLTQANEFLNELSQSNSTLAGFYIPNAALANKDFTQSLDSYMSSDRKITKIDVVFDVNPYTVTALNQIDDIKAAVTRAIKNTPLENAKVGIGGVSSTFNDLRHISNDDFSRTVMLMLIGIGLILIALFRSIIMPLYIIGSLIITYLTAMGISETIFANWLDLGGINWAVPFFGFVLLVALGVDYSIFLMDRFNEYRDLSVHDALLESMKNMGTVILSAAIILGGTFAAMMPSGVLTLMEIATIIIMGLVLYALLILPLFIPVMVRTFGNANWWPFKR